MTIANELTQEFHRVVEQFIGDWKGSGEVLPNPWGYSGTTNGRWQFSLALNQKHLLADFREERTDGSLFEGHGIMMPDLESQEILWFWFDSYGYPPIPAARGKRRESALVFEKVTPRGRGRTTLSVVGEQLHHEAAFQPHEAPDFIVVARGFYDKKNEQPSREVR
jgi:hypothetical protein